MKRDQISEQVPHRGDSGGVARAASHPAQGAQKQQRLPAVQIAEQLRGVARSLFTAKGVHYAHGAAAGVRQGLCGKYRSGWLAAACQRRAVVPVAG